MKKIYVLFWLSLCFCLTPYTSVYGQRQKRAPSKSTVVVTQPRSTSVSTKPKTQEGQKLLTNGNIIQMVKGGFGESVILNAIQTNETQFDLSFDALFELKNAGVSQKVIETMQFVAAGNRATPTVSEQVSATPPKNPTSDNSLSKQPEIGETSAIDMGVVVIDGSKRVEMKRSQSNVKTNSVGAMIPFSEKLKLNLLSMVVKRNFVLATRHQSLKSSFCLGLMPQTNLF